MKKVLVTGAAGFVGQHLIRKLIKNGYSVTALIRRRHEKDTIVRNTKVVIGDLSQKGSWRKALKEQDILIHLAAEISAKDPSLFEKNNVLATKNLLDAAKKANIRKIILFSSAAVTSIRRDPYAQTKKSQETLVAKSGIDYSIIRPSMIYGPGDNKNIGWLIKILKRLPIVPLPGGGNFGRQPVYVDDICQIVLKLVNKRFPQKIFEVHGYQYITLAKMVKTINKQLSSPKLIFPVPIFMLIATFWLAEKILPNPKFTVDQIKSLVSGEKFKGDKWWQIFDIIPTSFETGISKMVNKS